MHGVEVSALSGLGVVPHCFFLSSTPGFHRALEQQNCADRDTVVVFVLSSDGQLITISIVNSVMCQILS